MTKSQTQWWNIFYEEHGKFYEKVPLKESEFSLKMAEMLLCQIFLATFKYIVNVFKGIGWSCFQKNKGDCNNSWYGPFNVTGKLIIKQVNVIRVISFHNPPQSALGGQTSIFCLVGGQLGVRGLYTYSIATFAGGICSRSEHTREWDYRPAKVFCIFQCSMIWNIIW